MFSSLNLYHDLKRDLATIAQKALQLAEERKHQETESTIRELLSRLAEDNFNLAFLGQFSRGKTSLMNALIGRNSLPVGIIPFTSVITKVIYGTSERVFIRFDDSHLYSEIRINQLQDFVTEPGNPGNAKRVKGAEVQLPFELLRSGLALVDTPGVGSMFAENTETTDRFIPDVDAAIFVTSVDAPLTRDESQFFVRASREVQTCFFVLNKIDLVAGEEAEQTTQYVIEQLRQQGFDSPRVFAISARQALEGKLRHDSELVANSGIVSLEQALGVFIETEKPQVFAINMCRRLRNAIANLGEEERVRVLLRDLNRFQESLFQSKNKAANETEPPANALRGAAVRPRQQCNICTEAAPAMSRFFAQIQYDLSSKESTKTDHAVRNGFCPLHTWQYSEVASPRGVCLAYPELVESLAARLEGFADSSEMQQVFSGWEQCLACVELRALQQRLVSQLAKSLSANPQGPAVLCVPHLQLVLASLESAEARSNLARFHAFLLRRVADNMKGFVLKNSAYRRDLFLDEERAAYWIGLSLLVGNKNLCAPLHLERAI